jgi:DNA helicase HerA-like ATPase
MTKESDDMKELDMHGQVIGGEHGQVLLRQKSDQVIELGDLLIGEARDMKVLLQVYNLKYGSQIDDKTLQMMSGMQLEGYAGGRAEFMEKNLRSYVMAEVKALIVIPGDGGPPRTPKVLPTFFSNIYLVNKDDLGFIQKPKCPVFIGKVRSGSKVLDVDVHLNGVDMFTHHVLIPATTGRGKSNLVKVMLWSTIGKDDIGILVLDPHDEYFGRNGPGLKDHPEADPGVVYYSPNPPKGGQSLKINLTLVTPHQLSGIVHLTDAQREAVWTLHRMFRERWLEALFTEMDEDTISGLGIHPATISVLQRRFSLLFDIRLVEGHLYSRNNVFVAKGGKKFLDDVQGHLESGRKVIIDTSRLDHQAELLVGSMLASKAYFTYKGYKAENRLHECPVLSFVVEEAPRVLGTEERTIFGTIAREGRKFRIGITAITQLCSLIKREILANLNTKIILGNEMDQERRAIIASASQDLSADYKLLGALDRGEALVSSVFTKFAIPVQIPLFDDVVAQEGKATGGKRERTVLVGL